MAGARASDCPIVLLEEELAVATINPVGPGVGLIIEAFSDVDELFVMSKCSTMPEGGVTEVLELSPKWPITSVPFTVVVKDGATTMRVFAL